MTPKQIKLLDNLALLGRPALAHELVKGVVVHFVPQLVKGKVYTRASVATAMLVCLSKLGLCLRSKKHANVYWTITELGVYRLLSELREEI